VFAIQWMQVRHDIVSRVVEVHGAADDGIALCIMHPVSACASSRTQWNLRFPSFLPTSTCQIQSQQMTTGNACMYIKKASWLTRI